MQNIDRPTNSHHMIISKLLLVVGFTFTLHLSPFTLQAQDSAYARRVIRDLSSPEMFGRGMQNRGDSIAAEYLRQELMVNGVKPLTKNYFQYFIFPQTRTKPPIVRAGYRSQNVCGYIPGETDSMIVFTAHYEHLGMSGDTIFYGAHDNASGTAAMLDLARIVGSGQWVVDSTRGQVLPTTNHPLPTKYTYVFLFFGGEESGLIGSHYFADNPLINLNKVKLLVNIDLFCGGDEGLMVVNANTKETKPYVDLLTQINDEGHYAAKIGRRDNAANSDHYFFTRDCPSVFIYTLGGPYGGYHSPEDTCDGCGLGNYMNFMTLLRTFLEHL